MSVKVIQKTVKSIQARDIEFTMRVDASGSDVEIDVHYIMRDDQDGIHERGTRRVSMPSEFKTQFFDLLTKRLVRQLNDDLQFPA